ncbi:MAG: LysM peptidoglycan-binding protein [Frankiales bacterium]|nr:LysM peptidoglycan-binding protein [Frankiales bacterium]
MTTTTMRSAEHHSTPSVRLTRRGRVVLVLAVLVLALVAFTAGRGSSAQGVTDATARTPYASTTVHAGETLWSVAQRVAPSQDPRQVIAAIQQLNHLQGSTLQAGQQLLLPHAA